MMIFHFVSAFREEKKQTDDECFQSGWHENFSSPHTCVPFGFVFNHPAFGTVLVLVSVFLFFLFFLGEYLQYYPPMPQFPEGRTYWPLLRPTGQLMHNLGGCTVLNMYKYTWVHKKGYQFEHCRITYTYNKHIQNWKIFTYTYIKHIYLKRNTHLYKGI